MANPLSSRVASACHQPLPRPPARVAPVLERDRTQSTVLVTVVAQGGCARYNAGDISTFRREAFIFSDVGGEAIIQSPHRPRVADVVELLEDDSHCVDLFVRGLRFIAETHLTGELADFEDAGNWTSIMERFDMYA